jgi:transposase, IS6 family
VKGQVKYLYRAVDSTGQTIDFLLTAKRNAAGAKRFFRKVFSSSANPIPRVINVDKNPAYPAAISSLQREAVLYCSGRIGQSGGSKLSQLDHAANCRSRRKSFLA